MRASVLYTCWISRCKIRLYNQLCLECRSCFIYGSPSMDINTLDIISVYNTSWDTEAKHITLSKANPVSMATVIPTPWYNLHPETSALGGCTHTHTPISLSSIAVFEHLPPSLTVYPVSVSGKQHPAKQHSSRSSWTERDASGDDSWFSGSSHSDSLLHRLSTFLCLSASESLFCLSLWLIHDLVF